MKMKIFVHSKNVPSTTSLIIFLCIENDIFYLGDVEQKVQSYDENIGILLSKR